jgi:hypothetical protein
VKYPSHESFSLNTLTKPTPALASPQRRGWRADHCGARLHGLYLAYFFQRDSLASLGAEAPQATACVTGKETSLCERPIGGADTAAGSLCFLPF